LLNSEHQGMLPGLSEPKRQAEGGGTDRELRKYTRKSKISVLLIHLWADSLLGSFLVIGGSLFFEPLLYYHIERHRHKPRLCHHQSESAFSVSVRFPSCNFLFFFLPFLTLRSSHKLGSRSKFISFDVEGRPGGVDNANHPINHFVV